MKKKRIVVISKHPSFLEALKKLGLVREGEYEYYPFFHNDLNLKDADLICSQIPLKYAALAKTVTILDMIIPREKRDTELSVDDILTYTTRILKFKIELEKVIPFYPK